MPGSLNRVVVLIMVCLLLGAVQCSDSGDKLADGGSPPSGETPPPVADKPPAPEGPPKLPDTGPTATPPTAVLRLLRLDGQRFDLSARPLPLRVKIEATFSEPMDTASVGKAISVVDAKKSPVIGSLLWSGDKKTLLFTPQSSGKDVNLKAATAYKVVIAKSAVSATKKELAAPVEQSFTTMTPGDVNGDGFADIVVGAPDAGVAAEGRAYLHSGKDLTAGQRQSLTQVEGAEPSDSLGTAVAMVGDINADGFADFAAGAPSADLDPNTPNAGAVYLFTGNPGFSGVKLKGDAIVIPGPKAFDFLGNAVAGAGDTNADGYDELLAGAEGSDGNTGAAYLYNGAGLAAGRQERMSLAGGAAPGDAFGRSVAGAGDINRDGFADVIVGATGTNNSTGAAVIFSGKEPLGQILVKIDGENAGDLFGASVSSAGDVNGDGYADVIVGAPYANFAAQDNGTTYIFSGNLLTTTRDGTQSGLAFVSGSSDDDYLGNSVSGVGDLNNDGFSDIVIGAWGVDVGNASACGAAYVFLGGENFKGNQKPQNAVNLGTGGVSDQFGFSVSGAGDVTGDAIPDVIVGAKGASNDRGMVHVRRGGNLQGSPISINGEKANDTLGASVGGAW